ncbi:Outer membrane scaffolding protein for murein synthesis, MipA/OmpV family [Rhizobium sp. RU35A]|uniref:MipA/OmpV family protein n=1 Tax=Rhizobium sp. RU35A TaxID=1907414 RepID=UPI000954A005|nr:MipA/OmpV family protein [Rhizobium sp. RU35A]SIQ58714.1 Outer membrane scaffolding protein for murein synthesis, MipA/OmpV family [Rhizobium sp. RU35A]
MRHVNRSNRARIIRLGALALACLPVLGDFALADDTTPPGKDTYIITLGSTVSVGPTYPGSRRTSLSAAPDFDWRRLGEPEENSTPDDNFDLSLVDLGNFSAGPVIGIRDRRDERDEKALRGLKRIKIDMDAGLFAQYWFIPDAWRVRAEVRQAVFDNSGLVVDVGSDYFLRAGEHWLFSAGPRASFSNGAYAQRYFGVSAADAASNGRVQPYDADGGLQSLGLTVSAAYHFNEDWTVTAYGRYDRLLGDAANSPITSQFGSANQFTVGIGLTRAFRIAF